MNKTALRKQQTPGYHSKERPEKIEVVPTKETKTQRGLPHIRRRQIKCTADFSGIKTATGRQPEFIYQHKLLYFYTMSEQEIKAILLKINWDTPLSNDDLYQIFTGAVSQTGGIDKNWIYLRILNTFNWYTVLKIIPQKELPFLLSDEIINNLFPHSYAINTSMSKAY